MREAERLRAAYDRRRQRGLDSRYAQADPANRHLFEERQAALREALVAHGLLPNAGRRVLDAGCGAGASMRDLLDLGMRPEDLVGADLLPWRLPPADALPGAGLAVADARRLPFADAAFDLVLAFTLFSSIVDVPSRQEAAREVLRVLKAGGLALVYDFWTNPGNRDVRPLRLGELRRLFSGQRLRWRRLTLAPPLLRWLAPRSRLACRVLERVPFLRTHYLAAVTKEI